MIFGGSAPPPIPQEESQKWFMQTKICLNDSILSLGHAKATKTEVMLRDPT